MNKKTKKIVIFWCVIAGIMAAVLFIDLFLKARLENQYFSIIDGVLSVFYTLNTGGAWSILAGQVWLLILLSVVILIALFLFCILYKHKNVFIAVGAGLIFGGAIGNLVDRVFIGAVRDFIRLDFMDFPIFNIADCALCVGAVWICVYFLFFAGKVEKAGVESEAENGKN